MSTNEKFTDGDVLSLPVPDGTLAGAPVKIGILNGVTLTKEGEGGNADNFASVKLGGVHDFTVSFAISAVGDPVYITSGNALTATSSGNQLYGAALNTKGATSGTLSVRLTN
ncbi:MAG: DUF2190 family protein [Propionicimonas sp.]